MDHVSTYYFVLLNQEYLREELQVSLSFFTKDYMEDLVIDGWKCHICFSENHKWFGRFPRHSQFGNCMLEVEINIYEILKWSTQVLVFLRLLQLMAYINIASLFTHFPCSICELYIYMWNIIYNYIYNIRYIFSLIPFPDRKTESLKKKSVTSLSKEFWSPST